MSFLIFAFLPLAVLNWPASVARVHVQGNKPQVTSLSDAQKAAIKRIHEESTKKAVPVGLRLAAVARKIYENILADRPNETLRKRLSVQLKKAATDLLDIKGQSLRDTVKVLTPAQKHLIRSEMRKPRASADLSEVIAKTFDLENK